mmetsp:Transcript_45694/g.52817  ORF Transcript_45694/g.52817 Transcript_45694/m.52817 type:complete len:354 (-) Transcript_45694:196-1257(-)
MLDLVNPMTLFYTHQQLEEAQHILKEYEHHGNITTSSCSSYSNQVLWESKGIVEAMCHPDTHEIIPKPFRMAGFIPFNAPICLGALMATSPYSILFWQWSNQTHNALINYSNSNKSSTTSSTTCTIDGDDKEEESTSTSSSRSTMLQGYVGAVTGACGVSLGLKTFIDTNTSFNWSVTKKIKLQRYVALPAIAIGSAINVILMRRNELTTGINIYYENTDTTTDSTIEIVTVGSSQVAATKALQEMTISRMLLAVPVFLLPPLGVSFIDIIVAQHSMTVKRLMQKEKTMLVLNTFFVLLGFSIGLPATIALFPQIGSIPVTELEEKFQHIQDHNNKNDDGRRSIQVFKYNKGL